MSFFPKRSDKNPKIYGYIDLSSENKNFIKIGYTERTVQERMKEHYPTLTPGTKYKVVLEESAMRSDGTSFKDHDVHKMLKSIGKKNITGEWYDCTINEVKAAIIAIKKREFLDVERSQDFGLRPEQLNAITRTKNYFNSYNKFEKKTPHFLWNCKMRFGKTFASYKLMQEMDWTKVLILTFKPAVENSWKDDLLTHIDFKEYQFISRKEKSYEYIDKSKPFVCFASFQDFLGKNSIGGIKLKNQWAHQVEWDCIILDEYHYGAWRDTAKELYDSEENSEQNISLGAGIDDWDEEISPLKTKHYLYLSGTPFKAIQSGEFIEEQIFNWTYTDEQNSKENWIGDNNPYKSLPRIVMMTYKMPEAISSIAEKGEFNEFDLNEFFKAHDKGNSSSFKHEDAVQKWLDLIRGVGLTNIYDNLKLANDRAIMPFASSKLTSLLSHTFWFLPSISSCYAMRNILLRKNNNFYHDYEIIVCAGNNAGIGVDALKKVREKMDNPIKSKTITLSCGKLTTGVTVKPWTGVFFLRNTSSPETYFQTAFRVQSPWTYSSEKNSKIEEIIKKECYVFDFSPNRALRLIMDYSCRLEINEESPEKKVNDFIKFLPVLCFDGSTMQKLNAHQVLDYGLVGTTGSQLAKKFESPKLIHVDDGILKRIFENKKALDILMSIEGFRNINSDIEKIINQSDQIKRIKKETDVKDISKKQIKQLSEQEKTQKSLRKKLQEKLQKFASRIPVFMYLTDYREETLKDVILKLEPSLFKKVTSISVEDFEYLLGIGIFNSTFMNEAIFSFKRYENPSLHYEGFTKHNPDYIGLFDTKLKTSEVYN